MNSSQWRACGYKTIFIDNTVYLVRHLTGIVIHTPVNSGQWMNHDNVNDMPWTKESEGIQGLDYKIQKHINNAIDACYCDQGGVQLCDFCAGIRRP